MSPKEVALLVMLLLVGTVAVLSYTDAYPPSGGAENPADGVAADPTTESLFQNEGDVDGGDDVDDPEATPTESTTEPPAGFPAGLGRDRVENPTVLSRAHRKVLIEAGSWTRHTRTTVYVNGTESAMSVRTEKVSENRSLAAGRGVVRGDRAGELGLYTPDLEYWANGSLTVVRFLESNRTSVIERDDRYPVPFDLESTEWWTLYRVFAQTNTSFEGTVDRNGTTYYRVVATKPWYPDSPYRDVRDLTLSALITSEGLVEEYVVTFLRREAGHETRVIVHVEYTNVGTTTVSRPEWVPDNPENVSQTPDTATDAGYDSVSAGGFDPRTPVPSGPRIAKGPDRGPVQPPTRVGR